MIDWIYKCPSVGPSRRGSLIADDQPQPYYPSRKDLSQRRWSNASTDSQGDPFNVVLKHRKTVDKAGPSVPATVVIVSLWCDIAVKNWSD